MDKNIEVKERKIFYIDIGNLPAEKAAEYLEQIKKEILKKEIK